MGHNDKVKFYDDLPYIKAIDIIKNCDIGLILFNAFSLNTQNVGSNRIFDYMASELAVITTDLVEISRIVRKEKVGLIVPENYSKELTNLIFSISKDKTSIQSLKEQAKQSFINNYSWDLMERKIIKIYNYLLK